MTNIAVRCDTCHESPLLVALQITLTVCGKPRWARYEFDCPYCGDHNTKPADDHVVSLLMSGGVRATVVEIPMEFIEGHPDCGVITSDDMIEFHEMVAHINDLPVDQWL
jgi:hypothetical protein